MIERELDIATDDGPMNTFVVHPEEGERLPVVLFYMDAPGKREELHEMARRIAAVGYFVALPNLYHRDSRDFWLSDRSEATMARMYELMATLDARTSEVDTTALLRFVDADPRADAANVGAVGYCMSGPIVVWAAAAHPTRLKAIASIYGANLVTERPDSPHRIVGALRCEAYFACAEHDRWAPREAVDTLVAALEAAGVRYRLEWYPGAQHGFAFPLRAGIYDKPSAERHWERLFALFRRALGPGGAMSSPPTAAAATVATATAEATAEAATAETAVPAFERCVLETGPDGRARFRVETVALSEGTPASRLSPLRPSGGCQLRRSPVGFASTFHCTGAPQWVFILEGRMEIGLQDGSTRIFGPGEHFRSADLLPVGAMFDPHVHGHRSRQVGDAPLVTLFVRD